jgi:hypothetical protein
MIYNINAPNMNNVNLKSDFRFFFQGFIEIKRTIYINEIRTETKVCIE